VVIKKNKLRRSVRMLR